MALKSVLLLLLFLILIARVQAAELKSLRLFYDLPVEQNSKLDNTAKATPLAKTHALPGKRAPASDNKMAYQYNGFINTSAGKHFFINGNRLAHSEALKLVAIGYGGRKLRIKTRSGYVFEISIGQTVSLAKAVIESK